MALDDGTKMWWESGTIRGTIVGMVALIGLVLKLQPADQDSLSTIILAGLAFAGMAYAWYRRVFATQAIDKRPSLPVIWNPRNKDLEGQKR